MDNFDDKESEKMRRMKNVRRSITGILACAVLSTALCACGSSSAASGSYKNAAADTGAYYDEPMAAAESYDDAEMAMYDEAGAGSADATKTTENATTSNRKLIRTASLSVETKEFDEMLVNLDNKIKELGGYIESMNGNYGSVYSSYRTSKSADLTVRIPSAKVDEFINTIGTTANITYRSESVTDVTLDYVDMESHKKMLIEEQNRLMEFLDQAETVEEIISLEDRITSVKYQIDSMESQLRTYDNKVDYSTLNISIQEVIDYTPVVEEEELTPVERMKEGFMDSLTSIGIGFREFGIWVVVHLPYIVLLAIVAVIVLVVIKIVNKKNAAKREAYKEARLKREAEAAANREAGKTPDGGALYVSKPDKKD